MTGRDFLKSLREDNFALKSLEDRIVELRNNLYRVKTINYSKDRVDGGVPSDIADRTVFAGITEVSELKQMAWKP